MATSIRLSDEAELRLAELATLLHLSKNAVIEKAVLKLDERVSRRVSVRATPSTWSAPVTQGGRCPVTRTDDELVHDALDHLRVLRLHIRRADLAD